MAATFNPALTSDLDKVRYAVGDIVPTKAMVQDETITALLGATGATVASVSALVAQGILTQYQQRVSYDVDGEGERFSDLAKNYAATVALLNAKAAAELAAEATDEQVAASVAIGAGIMVGGLSRSRNLDKSEDCDRAANFSPRYPYE